VEELFEARNPKTPATMTEISGKASVKKKKDVVEITIKSTRLGQDSYDLYGDMQTLVKEGDSVKQKQSIARSMSDKNVIRALQSGIVLEVTDRKIVVRQDTKAEETYKIPANVTLIVKDGQEVEAGDPLSIGHLDLKKLMEIKGLPAVQAYVMNEVQHIYASQGQTINDKHIEIIVKQMLSKVRILDPGESRFLPGEITNVMRYERVNEEMRKDGKREAYGEQLLLGITKISLYTDSWLSAASFQETIRVLVEAAITRKVDYLDGLKENVIIGRLIPAGGTYRVAEDHGQN
jgi:DNA-directed RNA polymerase subunit beta'